MRFQHSFDTTFNRVPSTLILDLPKVANGYTDRWKKKRGTYTTIRINKAETRVTCILDKVKKAHGPILIPEEHCEVIV